MIATPQHRESTTVTTDGLRWWIVGVVVGAAVLVVASLSGQLNANVAPEADAAAVQAPSLLR